MIVYFSFYKHNCYDGSLFESHPSRQMNKQEQDHVQSIIIHAYLDKILPARPEKENIAISFMPDLNAQSGRYTFFTIQSSDKAAHVQPHGPMLIKVPSYFVLKEPKGLVQLTNLSMHDTTYDLVKESMASKYMSDSKYTLDVQLITCQDISFVVMPYLVSAVSLASYESILREQTITERIKVAMQLVECLQDLQRHKILHGDIKPGNILIDQTSKKLWLIDHENMQPWTSLTSFTTTSKSYTPPWAPVSDTNPTLLGYRRWIHDDVISLLRCMIDIFSKKTLIDLHHLHIQGLSEDPTFVNPIIDEAKATEIQDFDKNIHHSMFKLQHWLEQSNHKRFKLHKQFAKNITQLIPQFLDACYDKLHNRQDKRYVKVNRKRPISSVDHARSDRQFQANQALSSKFLCGDASHRASSRYQLGESRKTQQSIDHYGVIL